MEKRRLKVLLVRYNIHKLIFADIFLYNLFAFELIGTPRRNAVIIIIFIVRVLKANKAIRVYLATHLNR